MAKITDNLNPPPSPSRVFYSLGRMLGVEDFQADQDYHRSALARALLQLCGTGTVSGLNVAVPQTWRPNSPFAAWSFVYDSAQRIQVNTGKAGLSGPGPGAPAFAPAGSLNDGLNDGPNIIWTSFGTPMTSGWLPSTTFTAPAAIVDSNSNVQVLTATSPFTTGTLPPVWNTAVGSKTLDGASLAWTCVGPSLLEITVTPGLAVDRVGRMIEVPRTVCIFLQAWIDSQTVSDLNAAVHSGNLLVDVFATFVPCTRGVTPSFATDDDYDATDAFTANRLLDSFVMQLILRTDATPQLPRDPYQPDPWLGPATFPVDALTADIANAMKLSVLGVVSGPSAGNPFLASGPVPSEFPPGVDLSSVFLARIAIPSTLNADPSKAPALDLTALTVDNLSRLFLFPTSLIARAIGLNSGL